MKTLTQKVLSVCILILLGACARSPIKDRKEALRVSLNPPKAEDDLGIENFAKDLSTYLKNIEKTNFKSQNFTFQNQSWNGEDVLTSYKNLLLFLHSKPSVDELNAYIKDNYQWLDVYGNKDWSEVFITSYYEPHYKGSLKKNKKHTHPLYLKPKDLVQVDLESFARTHTQLEPQLGYILRSEPGPRSLSGRLDVGTNKIYPYYSREEIVEKNKLKGKNLEIVWLDPVDNFFLQIQGSGTIDIESGKSIQVGFAAQNGHSYIPIGRFVTDTIPMEEITMMKLKQYLKSLPYEEQSKILNQNPSYVFFQKLTSRPLTSQGTPVIDGRTIATDAFYLPRGFIGLLEFTKPNPDLNFTTVSRFVFNQDSGGAIKGPGRVDLFWGKGDEAGTLAGAMKHPGRLWFLAPKGLMLSRP